jgi:hypothetical protein
MPPGIEEMTGRAQSPSRFISLAVTNSRDEASAALAIPAVAPSAMARSPTFFTNCFATMPAPPRTAADGSQPIATSNTI